MVHYYIVNIHCTKGKPCLWDPLVLPTLTTHKYWEFHFFFSFWRKVNSDFVFYYNLRKHLDGSQYIRNFGCVWISAGIICEFFFSAYYFFFFQYMNNHVPTWSGMKLNLGGPEDLYSIPIKTVLMPSPFLILPFWKSFYWKDLIVLREYLLQVYTCTSLASWCKEQIEVKMAQGVVRGKWGQG